MTNVVRYDGEVTRGPSPAIWGDVSKVAQDEIMGKSILFRDDFAAVTNHASAQASGGYFTYQDTGVVITGQNTISDIANELGVLEVSGNDADNDEGHTQFGHGNMWHISNAGGNTGMVLFEARIATSTIADNGIALFVGLGQGNVGADYLVDDTGALIATRGFIGFQRLQDDGDKMDTTYQAASQTQQVVLANAVTLVADTYVKLGFKYDPHAVDVAKKIEFFVDGVKSNTAVSETDIDAATFPESEPLQPMILTKTGTASLTDTVSVDWVYAAQYCDGIVN